jgi:hypothetical protein
LIGHRVSLVHTCDCSGLLTRSWGRDQHEAVAGVLEADYLVVGAGATGMAFTDALLDHASSQYVIVGSGKTATDACIWLLDNGVDPGAICWVRPRDPWMLNRAVI